MSKDLSETVKNISMMLYYENQLLKYENDIKSN